MPTFENQNENQNQTPAMDQEQISLTAQEIASVVREYLAESTEPGKAPSADNDETLAAEIDALASEVKNMQKNFRPAELKEKIMARPISFLESGTFQRKDHYLRLKSYMDELENKQAELDRRRKVRTDSEAWAKANSQSAAEAPLINELAKLQADPTKNRARIKEIKRSLGW